MAPAPRCLALVVGLACALTLAARGKAAPLDDAAITAALESKYDHGVVRDLPLAQACYRLALERSAAGERADAIRLLEAASAFDPDYPDAHFTVARLVLTSDPGRAVGEVTEAFRILGRSYPWQRHLLANTATALVVVWMVSLLLAVIGIVLRHLPHLVHVLEESLGARGSRAGAIGATLIAIGPALWGLGAAATAAVFAGLLSFRFGKREALLVLVFVASALALAGWQGSVAPWAGSPRLDDPSLLVDRALHSGYDGDLARSLQSWEAKDTNEPLFPFALGTLRRRGGDLNGATEQLTVAAVLRPNTPWILTELGNVYFAREDYARARQLYESAAAADPGAVEPHFNLAQVYTKQLLFAEASREQSRASALAFDKVRDFTRIGAPQLNRTVMDARPPVEAFWALAARTGPHRGPAAVAENRYLAFALSLAPPAPFALVFLPALFLIFAGIGQVLGRGLATLHCSNCQKIVCRRCVHRMQQRAFCDDCFRTVKDLKSMEFTRLLLTRRDRSASRRRTIGQALLTFLLPGGGQMLRGAPLSGFFALLVMSAAGLLVIQNGAPVPSLDVLPLPGSDWAKRAPLLVLFFLVYAITVSRYFATTTAKVERLTSGEPRSRGGGARMRAVGRS
ncbi:MAG: tetratricopeptide repeat protein [Bacteroidota bacterium]